MRLLKQIGTFVVVLFAALLVLAGCGAPTVPPPVATDVYLDVPDSSTVALDGLTLGKGPRTVTVLENWPNYLSVDAWKLILWDIPGLDSLSLQGSSPDPGQARAVVHPTQVRP